MSFSYRRREGSEGRGVEGKYIPCSKYAVIVAIVTDDIHI